MPWTLDFLWEWVPRMGVVSAWRFRRHVINETNPPHELLSLNFRKPLRGPVVLRRWGSDFATLFSPA
jgi:hypothetical protein